MAKSEMCEINRLLFLYKNKKFDEVNNLSKTLKSKYPNNKKLNKILKKIKYKNGKIKNGTTLKSFLKMSYFNIFLFLIIFSISVFLIFFYKNAKNKFLVQYEKTENLIVELGDQKEAIQLTQESIKLTENIFDEKLKNKMEDMRNGFSEDIEKVGNLTEAKERLALQNKMIGELLEENKKIKKSFAIYKNQDGIKYFLVIGHNSMLADSVIIVAFNEKKKKINLISIPRDLQISGRKVSEIHSKYGSDTLATYISEICGLPIEKYFTIDFDSFVKTINNLGGIDIVVEKDIYDRSYPTDNKKYQTYQIKKGKHHLNGTEALKFARSRKSTSDYDRSRRQQKILSAVLDTIKEKYENKDVSEIVKFATSIFEMVKTNEKTVEIAKISSDIFDSKIKGHGSLDASKLLIEKRNIKGQSVLVPKDGNFDKIEKYIQEKLSD